MQFSKLHCITHSLILAVFGAMKEKSDMQYGGRPCKHKHAPHEAGETTELSDRKDMAA